MTQELRTMTEDAFFGRMQIKINDLASLGSSVIEETDDSLPSMIRM